MPSGSGRDFRRNARLKMKRTYMLIRSSKVDESFKQMFAINTTFNTLGEAIEWLHSEQKKNPDDEIIMLDENMRLWRS